MITEEWLQSATVIHAERDDSMKEMICSFIFALVFSCLINSIFQGQPPAYPWPVGISQVTESPLGLKREAGDIGEFGYYDGAKPTTIMTSIDDKSDQRNVDMPLGANN